MNASSRKLFVFLGLLFLQSVNSLEFYCETFQPFAWSRNNVQMTCFMNVRVIGRTPVQSRQQYRNAGGLHMQSNKYITALPENLNKVLSNLMTYDASGCGVRSLSKKNFEKMNKMETVLLNNNEIETVEDNTFEDCPQLKQVSMDNNKIKMMNGQVFVGLNNLDQVTLAENSCINENFDTPTKIANLPATTDQKCGAPKKREDQPTPCSAKADELKVCQTKLAAAMQGNTSQPGAGSKKPNACQGGGQSQPSIPANDKPLRDQMETKDREIDQLKKDLEAAKKENAARDKKIEEIGKQITSLLGSCGK